MSSAPTPRRRPIAPALGLYPMELSRNLKVDSVSRLDPSPPRRVDADDTVERAVEEMRVWGVGCLLVTEEGRVIGVFTERDLLVRVLAPGKPLDAPVRRYMTAPAVTVSPKTSVRLAIKKMQKNGYRHLPVVDENARPVGVLSARRVVHYLVEHFPALVFNLPPEPDRFPETAEGA